MKPFSKNWLLVLAWMAGILYFSSRPDPIGHLLSFSGKTSVAVAATVDTSVSVINTETVNLPHRPALLNYAAHFSEYTGLMFVLLIALYSPNRKMKTVSYTSILSIAFCIAISFALFDEVYQELWPGRGFAFSDLGFDLLGIIAASIIFGVIISRTLEK